MKQKLFSVLVLIFFLFQLSGCVPPNTDTPDAPTKQNPAETEPLDKHPKMPDKNNPEQKPEAKKKTKPEIKLEPGYSPVKDSASDAELIFMVPEQNTEEVTGKQPVTFLWDKPVFVLQNPEKTQKWLEQNVQVKPEIEGMWQQLGSTGILFEPKESWKGSTEYTITIPDSISPKKIELSFKTPTIKLQRIDASELIFRKPLTIHFNQPISLEQAQKFILSPQMDFDVEYGENKNFVEPFISTCRDTAPDSCEEEEAKKFKTAQNIIKLIPRSDWPVDTQYTLTVPAGTESLEGNLYTLFRQENTFHTIEKFDVRDTHKPDDVFQNFSVSFTTPVTYETMVKNVEITPQPEEDAWNSYLENLKTNNCRYAEEVGETCASSHISFPPPEAYWNPETEYKVSFPAGMKDKYGRELPVKMAWSFSTKFPTTFRQVFLPEQNAVIKRDTQFEPTFWYSGQITKAEVTVESFLLNKKTAKKSYDIEPSPDKEAFWSFDLREDFPDFFDENGDFIPDKYRINVKAEKSASLKSLVGRGDYWWPQEHQTEFYIADFSVVMKNMANDRYETEVFPFPEASNLEGEASGTLYTSEYDYQNQKRTYEIEKILPNIPLNNPYKFTASHFDELVFQVGDQVGFGSRRFQDGIAVHDTKVTYNEYQYHKQNQEMRSVTFTDRPLFKPGQRVYFKSIFRNLNLQGKQFPLEEVSGQNYAYTITIRDPRWDEVATIDGETTGNGSLDGYWDIPDGVRHGDYQMEIRMQNGRGNVESASFYVGEYRKANFLLEAELVDTETEKELSRALWKELALAKINAEYAFGGALKNRRVHYRLFLQGHNDCFWGCYYCEDFLCGSQEKTLKEAEGILDNQGNFQIPIDLDIDLKSENKESTQTPNWNSLNLNVTVYASDDEEQSQSISIPFYTASEKIKLDSGKYHYEKGEDIEVSGQITDLDEKPLADKNLTIKILKRDWVYELSAQTNRKSWTEKTEVVQTETVKSNNEGRFETKLNAPKDPGSYQIVVNSTDKKQRKTTAEQYFWIPGVDDRELQVEDDNKILRLILNQDKYEVGENAEIFFPHSAWKITRARATVERGDVLQELAVNTEEQTLSLPLEKWMVPNVYVSLWIEGTDNEGNPHVKWGAVKIPVNDPDRKLGITLTPGKATYRPGEEVVLNITTTAANKSIPAELTLMVVDETLLAIKAGQEINIYEKFLADLPLGVNTTHTLANFISQWEIQKVIEKMKDLTLRDPEQDLAQPMMMDNGATFGGAQRSKSALNLMMKSESMDMVQESAEFEASMAGGGTAPASTPAPRSDFQDTAEFIAAVTTDENGKGEVRFTLPDNLTTWRISAVGHSKNNAFGEGETSIQTSLPLLISEIVPNFFQMGDEMEIGLLIRRDMPENEAENITVNLNLPEGFVSENTKKTVEVDEEARVFFTVKIPNMCDDNIEACRANADVKEVAFGFDIQAEDSGLTDSIELTRKVYPPKIAMTAAEFLRVEDKQEIKIQPDLERALSSHVLVKVFVSLVDKLPNFIDVTREMNYGCTEQRFSNSTAVLTQKEFDKKLGRASGEINYDELTENRDFIVKAFQEGSGVKFWPSSDRPSAWVTAQILEYAELWKKYDAPFPEPKLAAARNWLKREIMRECDWREGGYGCMSDTTRQHAAYILVQNDLINADELHELSEETSPLEAKLLWLKTARYLKNLGTSLNAKDEEYVETIWKEIDSNLKARDRYIFWEELDGYRSFYSQNERLSALIFGEMMVQDRFPDLHPKIVRYLSETSTKHASGNTALRMLEVLGDYAVDHETGNVGAEVVIRKMEDIVSDTHIRKAELKTLSQVTSFTENITGNEDFKGLELETQNEKAYYADIELQETFPAKLVDSVQKGFWLERGIYGLEDENFEDPLTELQVGKNYVVRLKLITNTSHRQIMLEDKIPAGAEFVNFDFENVNQELAQYAEEEPQMYGYGGMRGSRHYEMPPRCWGWCVPTFDHKEFHAEKVRFFADYVQPGTYEVKYVIKTRLPGDFEVLPAKVEEMYYPEVFATTDGAEIKIVREEE